MTNRLVDDSDRFYLDGSLLVAAPDWEHELFSHSVCLVVHHDRQGAVGVFLNRSLQTAASGLWKYLADGKPTAVEASVNFGGPKSGPVVAVHDREELAEFRSAAGVYLAAQVANLKTLVTTAAKGSQVRIIVGQADWSAGQLDEQITAGHWLPLPVSPRVVFADATEMWNTALRDVGNYFVASITGAGPLPPHALAN